MSATAWVSTYGLPFERPITPDTAAAECSNDPDAFLGRVKQRAEQDLRAMKDTRNTLRTSRVDVENKQAEVQEKLHYATKAAADFRSAWQNDGFPVMIHGRAYTKTDVEAQTSSLVAQTDGYTEALAKHTRTITRSAKVSTRRHDLKGRGRS